MKTQYYTATSLDGFLATEDDSLEWLFPLVSRWAAAWQSCVIRFSEVIRRERLTGHIADNFQLLHAVRRSTIPKIVHTDGVLQK